MPPINPHKDEENTDSKQSASKVFRRNPSLEGLPVEDKNAKIMGVEDSTPKTMPRLG